MQYIYVQKDLWPSCSSMYVCMLRARKLSSFVAFEYLRKCGNLCINKFLTALYLWQLMIERPILCLNDNDKQKIRELDEQREKVEKIIATMHLTLARFRPYQARQALITTLRAQVDRRRKEAKELRCDNSPCNAHVGTSCRAAAKAACSWCM